MIRWNNDYNRMAHPEVLKALMSTEGDAFAGYGGDEWCDKAANLIKDLVGRPDSEVFFLPGATQANFIIIDAALRPVESVICADSGHIFCHEAGSIERTSHKMLALPPNNAKITAEQIKREASAYYDGGKPEFLTIPRMVYISFATEYGTLYSLKELEEIHEVCKEYDLYLFVDGARLGYGLGSEENDVTLKDFGRLCDAFYIGGTKCGAMFGEALVITNPDIQRGFRTHMKQKGAVMAKSWLMGVQFYALLKDGLYFDICKNACKYAVEIREAFRQAGTGFLIESPTNQQFVILNDSQYEKLSKNHIFEDMGIVENSRESAGFGENAGRMHLVRFCTSWATTREEVEELLEDIRAL